MRGKVSRCLSFCPCLRITPAYAGKRYLACVEVAKIQDHPRLCGEKPEVVRAVKQGRGSPPPMRGKDGNALVYGDARGITPAYAGKRNHGVQAGFVDRDHPRLCGEKPVQISHSAAIPGSPPPMRGKARLSRSCRVLVGITPAYAGKSYYVPLWVPPRAGSPPPMRGKD